MVIQGSPQIEGCMTRLVEHGACNYKSLIGDPIIVINYI